MAALLRNRRYDNDMYIAPVLITVYDRLQHFQGCVESLRRNVYAENTDLFIAIDYPRDDKAVTSNMAIKEYCKTISGFKHVTIYARDRNYGSRENGLLAKKEILSYYDSIIITEDDNLFSRYFLKFINEGLSKYHYNESILAICGYQFPKVENQCRSDIMMIHGFSPWGYGIWKDRISKIEYEIKDYYKIFIDKNYYCRFIQLMGGKFFTSLLIANIRNEVYGDISVNYSIYKNNLQCVFPKKTLVLNKGQDGSGLHSSRNSYFDKQFIDNQFDPSGDARFESRCQEMFAREMKYPMYKQLYYYFLYKSIARIMNR